MSLLLQDKLDECNSKEVRCVYITGAGKAFSSGQDLDEVFAPDGAKIEHIFNFINTNNYRIAAMNNWQPLQKNHSKKPPIIFDGAVNGSFV